MHCSTDLPTKSLILIALLQGLALLLLHQSMEQQFWPYGQPSWLFTFYSICLVAPTMLLLGLKSGAQKVVYVWVTGFAMIVAVLGYYVGHQAMPLANISLEPLVFSTIVTLCVATFKALLYVQHFSTAEPLSYSRLFLWSWRNFLTLGLALLFTLCLWGILLLWAALFKAINIDFFYDLFTKKWFIYPALALANGFGVIIFRQQANVIDTITRIQQALMKFLLVILVLVSILFLIAVLISGFGPLWKSGGSGLILSMQLLMLFLLNAVYQDDPTIVPYRIYIHRFIYIGIAFLPLYSAISFYGLATRVDQYGWTVSRCWAFLLWALLALFSLAYCGAIAKLKDRWLNQLSWINVRMSLVVLGVMLLVNTPWLDFRKITTKSQINRLEQGLVTLEGFDYNYFSQQLAGPGYEALQKLKGDLRETEPEIVFKIDSIYADKDDMESTRNNFYAAIKLINTDLPDDLRAALFDMVSKNQWAMTESKGYYLIKQDLNADGVSEYIFIERQERYQQLNMFFRDGDKWSIKKLQKTSHNNQFETDLFESIINQDTAVIEPDWHHLKVGDRVYQVQ